MTLDANNYMTTITDYVDKSNLVGLDTKAYFKKVESGLAERMTAEEMAHYCSEVAASMITIHPSYNALASIILVNHLHSSTMSTFTEKIMFIQQKKGIFNDEKVQYIMENADFINASIDYSRDYNFDYFGLVSLQKSYLIRIEDHVIERPQDMYMRVAVELCCGNLEALVDTYNLLSNQYYTHATPTLYNSCFKKNQLASCFLQAMKDDTIAGIFSTLSESATYSKLSGGIGIHLSNIRCNNSPLVTTGGVSKGIIPVLKLFNDCMKYINQGGARRCATSAFYLEPWHKDIFDFLDLRKNTGIEERRARDSFTALCINDLFMERVEKGEDWSLFDPNVALGLADVHGEEFNKLYVHYEKTVDRTTIPAQKLWKEIICSQIETGSPYMVYKDAVNKSSNHNNLGTIKSSNLCAEIVEYSDAEMTAVCNLASVCLPKFIRQIPGTDKMSYDFHSLYAVTKKVVGNLNRMIDNAKFPTPESQRSNDLTRTMGIGVQGLADVFFKLDYPFESENARKLNLAIFETMYFAAMEASCEIAAIDGPYPLFEGSMYSKGIFHFEKFWEGKEIKLSGMWDWEGLRENIKKHGLRNSLTLACMPTASTAQICGNSECIEPVQSNVFTRRTFAGEFQIVNKYLMGDLMKLGLWSNEMRQLIIEYNGSIQEIPVIPQHIKDLYKTVWELKMKRIIDMSVDRQAFIDQSQSLNLFVAQPTYAILSSMHFYGWKNGLKTGMYYLRTCPLASAIKFTVDKELILKTLSSMKGPNEENENEEKNDAYCESCSC